MEQLGNFTKTIWNILWNIPHIRVDEIVKYWMNWMNVYTFRWIKKLIQILDVNGFITTVKITNDIALGEKKPCLKVIRKNLRPRKAHEPPFKHFLITRLINFWSGPGLSKLYTPQSMHFPMNYFYLHVTAYFLWFFIFLGKWPH